MARQELGLRERKKQQTRLAISQVATRLFIERGFDSVTVAEVAEAAQVSVNTVFNYFSTKEDLFFDRGEEVVELPSRLVRERKPGESVVDALERGLREAMKGQAGLHSAQRLRPFLATIEASPALRARERVLIEQSEARLARTLSEERGGRAEDPTARVVAAMVTGLEWMLVQDYRARLMRGETDAAIRTALTRLAARAFSLLRAGVGDYGRRESGAA